MINEKSKSKTQQRLMGWALACLRGEQDKCPKSIVDVGKSFVKKGKKKGIKNLEDFAKTKHKGLPERKKKNESIKVFREFIKESNIPNLGMVTVTLPLNDVIKDYSILIEFNNGSLIEYNYSDRGKSDFYLTWDDYEKETGWGKEELNDFDKLKNNISTEISKWFEENTKLKVENIFKITL